MSHREERASDDALRNHPLRDTQEFESDIRPREAPSNEPRVGPAGAVGGAGGALAGAGLGTIIGGPIGAIVGAIAGAVGGWWAGQAAADPTTTIAAEDESRYRALYEESPNRLADRTYDDVRPFYQLGHLARSNPDYRDRPFEEIEADLQKGWTPDLRARYGEWGYARPFAREAFSSRKSE